MIAVFFLTVYINFVLNLEENMNNTEKQNVLKRMEVLGEALQTALEAILEMQTEHKLITYLLLEENGENE